MQTSKHEEFRYWIKERYDIFFKKKNGVEKPWSTDPVFQRTYFCNVRREDDKVTKWIRSFYSPHVSHALFEYNIILSRFLNWPDTLAHIGYQYAHEPAKVNFRLRELAQKGKVWGNAYVITTHGQRMEKVDYLTKQVLEAAFERSRAVKIACLGGSGGAVLRVLEGMNGIGSFLAGQIIADLKNTPGHPLAEMKDWMTFVVPGPGSIKGLSWYFYGEPGHVTYANFPEHFDQMAHNIRAQWWLTVPPICNQDLQNCLCEFDKYMRVSTGVGRSKRNYNGL